MMKASRKSGRQEVEDMYRAMIIDDDQWAIADMKRCFAFERHGFCLCGAYYSAEDALTAILADPPDLIISDICMESNSGLDLARICREKGVDALIVLVSGYDDFAYVQEAFRQNVFQYLLKPLDDEQVAQVMVRAKERLHAAAPKARPGNMDVVERTIQLIEQRYMDIDLRLDQLADEVHTNKNYLSELFRQRTGVTFTDYKNQVRVRHAKRLIREGREGMTQIALSVGFDSASYFSRIFKQYMGLTPQEYRKEAESAADGKRREEKNESSHHRFNA